MTTTHTPLPRMKRTPWLSARKHRPVHAGRYEFFDVLVGQIFLAEWDGDRWAFESVYSLLYPGDKWRGLTKESR